MGIITTGGGAEELEMDGERVRGKEGEKEVWGGGGGKEGEKKKKKKKKIFQFRRKS